ncbi:MAG: hypothetical protein JSV68_18285 [Anaerolineaceae bacterium]|nr:MAG: hypothetical protein JSV68_18285 [Anaerolineaceae bacterium]
MEKQEASVDEPQEEPTEESVQQEGPEGDDKGAGVREADSTSERKNRQEGRPGDTLSWLEGPAFSAPIEEMPTLQWPKIPDEEGGPDHAQAVVASSQEIAEPEAGEPLDELDEAIDWLEKLGEEQGTPMDEMPTLVSAAIKEEGSAEDTVVKGNSEQAAASSPPPEQVDSDPMAWLEQLAIDQSSPLEELPSVADRLLVSDIASQIESDEGGDPQLIALASQAADLDKALSYLEQLAEAQGISLDDAGFDQLDLDDSAEEPSNTSEQIASDKIPAPIVASAAIALASEQMGKGDADIVEEMPDDPDAALSWLAELEEADVGAETDLDALTNVEKGSTGIIDATEESGEVVPEYGQAEYDQKVIESALDEEFLEEMPDDPDEAMTWMAGLAAQQAIKRKGQPQPVAVDVQGDKEQKDGSEGESAPIAENPEFEQARIALTSGNIDEAEAVYRSLLESDQGGPALIQELEKAVSDQPEESQLLQLLGDAYMQNGQLQKALRTYRSGIDHL